MTINHKYIELIKTESKRAFFRVFFILFISFLFILLPSSHAFGQIHFKKENGGYLLNYAYTLGQQIFILILPIIFSIFFKKKTFLSKLAYNIILVISSFYYTLYLISFSYFYYTDSSLDIKFIMDYGFDLFTGLVEMYNYKIISLGILFFCLIFLFSYLSMKKLTDIANKKLGNQKTYFKLISILIVTIFLIFIPAPQGKGLCQFVGCNIFNQDYNKIKIVSPSINLDETISSTENVFILQLESVNALEILNNIPPWESGNFDYSYMPNLRKISTEGVLFPYFWANSVQTVSAQISLVCGVSNDLGRPLSLRFKDKKNPCLSEILNKSGYKNYFFTNSNPYFANTYDFLKNIKFDKIYYKSLNKKNDKKYGWAYTDDCTFYDRVFKELETKKSDKNTFTYISVAMHHYPWNGAKIFSKINPIKNPKSTREKYLNSYFQQDYCLAKFYENFKKFNNGNSHLFIVGDHSFPVGLNNNTMSTVGTYNDNFLVNAVYIPPVNTKDNFYLNKIITDKIYGQVDIYPTLLELLNDKDYPGSFAYELKKNKTIKENTPCYLLNQPYDNGIKIIKTSGLKKEVINTNNKTLKSVDFSNWKENKTTNNFYYINCR